MIKLRYFTFVFAVVLLLSIIYVSILGENNLIEKNVEGFFGLIYEEKHREACNMYGVKNLCAMNNKNIENQFNITALELSLIKHYDLFDAAQYNIEAKKERMWFPYITNEEVKVSVKLSRRSSKLSDVLSKENSDYIKNLITVKRISGQWKIFGINIEGSKLSNEYDEILKKIDIDKHILVEGNLIRLQAIEIDRENASAEDIMIMMRIIEQFKTLAATQNDQ